MKYWILALLAAVQLNAGTLVELATELEGLLTLSNRVAEIETKLSSGAFQPSGAQKPELFDTLKKRVEYFGHLNINDPELPGSNDDERYENAVQFILDTWGYDLYANPHVGGAGPDYEGFRGVSQATLPGIFYPAGHYDFHRTLWLHTAIKVFGDGNQWGTRWWFWPNEAEPEAYTTDRSFWIEGKKNGTETNLPVMIGIPAPVRHSNGQLWRPYQVALENVNCKFAVDPGCVGIGIFGVQTNLRIENVHLITDKGRDRSVALNTVPASYERELPWGARMETFKDNNGIYVCQLLDATIDVMCEYWACGPRLNGMGIKLSGRSYYTLQGFYIYGRGVNGRDELLVFWNHNEHGLRDRAGQSLAGIVTPNVNPRNIIVTSPSPVWINPSTAPETRGLFVKGQGVY